MKELELLLSFTGFQLIFGSPNPVDDVMLGLHLHLILMFVIFSKNFEMKRDRVWTSFGKVSYITLYSI